MRATKEQKGKVPEIDLEEGWARLRKARERIDAAHVLIQKAHPLPMPDEPIEVQPTPVWLAFHVAKYERQADLAEYLGHILEKCDFDQDKAMEYISGRMG